MARTRLEIAIRQIEFARSYTQQLLSDLQPDDWFRRPAGGITHLAWQVGHLAMAEYGLTMLRIRGKEPEDQQIISNHFIRRFRKGSDPQDAAEDDPPIDEIRRVFGSVHVHALRELDGYTDEELDVKLPEPHAVFDTKLGSLFFCSAHEMLHAGQIGLIRRQLGKTPLR